MLIDQMVIASINFYQLQRREDRRN